MKIDNFKINNYGKIENREVILKNGINLIKGYNEAGKSTILSFLNSMLYGIDKTKKGNISEYDKYLPWLSTNFSGSMEYSLSDGQKYYVFRDFKKKIPVVLDKNRNDITLNFKQSRKGIDFLDEQIGVDKKTFENTSISYQKLVVLDDKNKAEMAGRLANLVSTGEENFSYEELIKKLNNKQLEEIGSSRTKKRPINNIEERILKLEKEKMEVLNVKDKKERMNEEREETQKQFATIGYIKQMINEIKENFLKKEAEKKIYSEIYNRIEKKKEEIEEKKKERIDVITKEKVFDRIKWIYLVLTLIVIPAAYFYIYSLIVYVLALIVVYILPIFFINEMGVKTPAKQFNEFLSGLNEFINTAKDYKSSSAIYFHKDDMYKGYLPYEKVITLVDKLSKEKINNKTIIEYLVTNKVLLPIVMPKGKSDTTMAMAVTALDLDEKAKEIKFMVSSKDKDIEDVVIGDIK